MSVVAVLCSDIHLSHKVPVARSAEPNWYDAMKRPLDELNQIRLQYKVPIICAGDIFDRWNSYPELINFAIDFLPRMYAIPGQHDLPNHSLKEIKRSAYWTLAKCEIIKNLDCICFSLRNLRIYPFPWSTDVVPIEQEEDKLGLAVIHAYIWKKGSSYPGASDDARVANWYEQLDGYSAAVYGDNHKGFLNNPNHQIPIFNCGTLIRRKMDEIDYKPQIGLLYENGTIEPHYLDTSKDKFIDPDDVPTSKNMIESTEFLNALRSLGGDSLDFREAIYRYLKDNDLNDATKSYIVESIEES